jgi:hypothetical protein
MLFLAFTNVHLFALVLISVIFIYFIAFTNIHLFILHTNKPLSSLCLQAIETCQKKGSL